MEENKKSASSSAEHIKNQAVEMVSKIDVRKAVGWTDAFMEKVFLFGKIIAALFMFVCLLVMVGSLLYWVFSGKPDVKIPEFENDAKESFEVKLSKNGNGSANTGADLTLLRKKNAIRKQFESSLMSLMELLQNQGQNAEAEYEGYIERITKMDEDLRKDYIAGTVDFVKDAKKFYEKKEKKFDADAAHDVLSRYQELYRAALDEVEKAAIKAEVKQTTALLLCGGALICLILFLIIPLLIQIEENTRKN